MKLKVGRRDIFLEHQKSPVSVKRWFVTRQNRGAYTYLTVCTNHTSIKDRNNFDSSGGEVRHYRHRSDMRNGLTKSV